MEASDRQYPGLHPSRRRTQCTTGQAIPRPRIRWRRTLQPLCARLGGRVGNRKAVKRSFSDRESGVEQHRLLGHTFTDSSCMKGAVTATCGESNESKCSSTGDAILEDVRSQSCSLK